jgi:hypothetical protein
VLPLADLAAVEARVDWVLDSAEVALATAALEEASDLAREVAGATWTSPATAPRLVQGLVATAVARLLRNPDNYVSSRAGDEAVQWAEPDQAAAGLVRFTPTEIRLLQGLAGTASFGTIGVIAWGSGPPGPLRDRTGYVPVDGGEAPIPMFADVSEPW